MHKILTAFAVAVGVLIAGSLSAWAITFGNLDGNNHPNVGALVAEYIEPGEKDILCSGTLISPKVFLTASHCTAFLASIGIAPDQVWVTFDPEFHRETAKLYRGTYHTHPDFGHDQSDPHDIAVVVLDKAVKITPAQLPTEGLLDQMKDQGTLKNQQFIAVGYGTVRTSKTTGPNNFTFDGARRYVEQSFQALTDTWLKISQNPATGDGGTCYGDSGGPHFLGSNNLIVALTVTGDSACRSTDVDYRLDTVSARSFLADFVTLP